MNIAQRQLESSTVALWPTADETCLIMDAPGALALVASLPVTPNVVLTTLSLLDRPMLQSVAPTRVVIPLIGPRFDAVQALTRLAELRFSGIVCILTGPLPAPGLVRAELAQIAPGMTLHLIQIDHRGMASAACA